MVLRLVRLRSRLRDSAVVLAVDAFDPGGGEPRLSRLQPAAIPGDLLDPFDERFPVTVRLQPPLQQASGLGLVAGKAYNGRAIHEGHTTERVERLFEPGQKLCRQRGQALAFRYVSSVNGISMRGAALSYSRRQSASVR